MVFAKDFFFLFYGNRFEKRAIIEDDQVLYQNHRNKLFAWAGARGLIGGDDFKYLVLYHDNPKVALSDNLRMSLCITVPPQTKVGGEIGKMALAAATYAICRFELKAPDFPKAWEWVYGHWLPNSGYQPDDKPYFETYPEEPKGETYLVDFCIPVIPVPKEIIRLFLGSFLNNGLELLLHFFGQLTGFSICAGYFF